MADFSQNISNFTKFGTYNYQFDEVGNEILNPSSSIFQQTYFAFSLLDLNYDQTKVLSFYDPTFIEFTKPVSETTGSEASASLDEVQQQLASVRSENSQLQTQLNELIAQSEITSNTATQQLIKDIVIGLRIQLGQGKIEGDFNTEFPYLPLPLEEQPSNQQ